MQGTEYYAPWSYPASINGELDAKNSIYRPVSLVRVKHVTPQSALEQTVHVTVALDNLILAVAANDSAPYLATSSYTQLIDRWYHNPLENRVAQCQQQYESIVLDALRQPRCLPHCARDSQRDLHEIDRIDGVEVVDDVTPVRSACQTLLGARVSQAQGPRSLAQLSRVSKCDAQHVTLWSARYIEVTPVNDSIALREIMVRFHHEWTR